VINKRKALLETEIKKLRGDGKIRFTTGIAQAVSGIQVEKPAKQLTKPGGSCQDTHQRACPGS
jgi:hypothetical protein